MSFYADWLHECYSITHAVLETHQDRYSEQDKRIARMYYWVWKRMARAKIIRCARDQAQCLLDQPRSSGQNYAAWLRLPFPEVYLELNGAISLDKRESSHESGPARRFKAMGILLIEQEIDADGQRFLTHEDSYAPIPHGAKRLISAALFEPPASEMYYLGLSIFVFNDHIEYAVPRPDILETSARLMTFTIHLINFLSSPSVKLVRQEPSAALQKQRQRRGKQPLPGWYEITYRQVIQDYTKDKIATGVHHGFRYDVRGHFKTFTRGPMAGRVIWCPAHQRGLQHQLYKPKRYQIA